MAPGDPAAALPARRSRGEPGPARPPRAAKTAPGHYHPNPATPRPPEGYSTAPSQPAARSCRTRPEHTPGPAAGPAPRRAPAPGENGPQNPVADGARAAWWPAGHPARKRQPRQGEAREAQPSATYTSAHPAMASFAAGCRQSNGRLPAAPWLNAPPCWLALTGLAGRPGGTFVPGSAVRKIPPA